MVSNSIFHKGSPGREQLPREVLNTYKRERVARAIAELVRDIPPHQLTVSLITERAKMARNTFYELFGSRDEALYFAVVTGKDKLKDAVAAAMTRGADWPGRVEAVIAALIEAVVAEPYLSELCLVHSWACAAPTRHLCDTELVEELAGLLRAGRAQAPSPGPGPRTEELLAHAIIAVLAERLRREGTESLHEVGGELSEIAMLPFLDSPEIERTANSHPS